MIHVYHRLAHSNVKVQMPIEIHGSMTVLVRKCIPLINVNIYFK